MKSLREEVFKFALENYGTVPDYPWEDMGQSAVLRHKNNKKWYGLVMNIPKKKIGLTGQEKIDILNVKCDPIFIGTLLKNEGFFPAYHMNKTNWITIALDGRVTPEQVFDLLNLSYELTS